MKIWISKPHGARLGGQEENLRDKWTMTGRYAKADVEFLEARKHQIHGELLQEIWETRILPSDDPIHLISEMDFVPTRQAACRLLEQARVSRLSLIGVPYVHRVYAPGQRPSQHPGSIRGFRHLGHPLLGAWLLFLDLSSGRHSGLPIDWLGTGGPHNDAANLALATAHEHKFLGSLAGGFALLEGRDAFPSIHGIRYSGLGVHGFFARSLDAPDDTVICWPQQPSSLTAGQHRSNFRMLVR